MTGTGGAAGLRLLLSEVIDDVLAGLTPAERVDRDIAATALSARLFDLDELREHEWNPLAANPGTAIHLLLARDFAPLDQRLSSVAGRLAQIPAALAQARADLERMPAVHVQTAIGQFTGTRTLLATEVERALGQCPSARAGTEPALQAAIDAVEVHLAWLHERLDDADGDPRLGAERFTRRFALALDTATDPAEVLTRAEADVEERSAEIAELAARVGGSPPGPGQVGGVLDRLAADHPDDTTVVDLARAALAQTTAFVREHALVTVHDDPVEVVVMPEIHRGVAVAYCQPPGPLEPEVLATFYAISLTPADWSPERVASFYREYNTHMIHNLTVHEAMPGHVLQLAHARRADTATPVRTALRNGPFVEGWAVYAEELMTRHGYGGDAVRMQRLKMALRMTINTILDIRVHTDRMPREEAMRLMLERGRQEEGEAAGKWRRALLTSTQLSTYYVGYTEVADLAARLGVDRPQDTVQARHDAMLAHGSPPPRHLATLLDPAPFGAAPPPRPGPSIG